jgi:DNA-binding MurR/RpiR family transcriptional regulator
MRAGQRADGQNVAMGASPKSRDGISPAGAPWTTTLEARVAQAQPNLSASRKRLIREILDHPEDTYFLSSRALAKHYDVNTATIVRTVQALGYQRFADFTADLRSHFVTHITPYAVMKSTAREKRSIADHINHSLEMDERNLHALHSSLDVARVTELARRVHRAHRIVVIGIDFAASLSHMLAYALVSIGLDAEAPVGSAGNLQQKIFLLGPKDLLIAISFGRCLQDTVDAVLVAHKNGVPTFGITDSDKTPIARFCDSFWITSIANPSFHGSYVAPLAAMNALLIACAQIKPQQSLAVLRRKEQEFRSRWYSSRTPAEEQAGNGQRKKG